MSKTHSKLRVLVADDHTAVRLGIRSALETRYALDCTEASDARAALEHAAARQFDLILLDIHLPDLNGWDVFSQLRGEETTRNIPVIVISADATARQIQQFMAAGARDYLTKPLDVTKFSRVIEESAWPSTDSPSPRASASSPRWSC